MLKKRLTLSLIALISSLLLFVMASFAWFTLSEIVNIGGPDIDLINIDATASLQVSTDGGTNYVGVDNIIITGGVPGDVYYYRILLENTGNINVDSKITLVGFTDAVADPLGNPTNFNNGNTLLDVILINASNTFNAEVITNQLMSNLLTFMPSGDYSNSRFAIVSSMALTPSDSVIVYFTFTISDTTGNDYQNLKLFISYISIQSQN